MKIAFLNGHVIIHEPKDPSLAIRVFGDPPREETLEVIREIVHREHGSQAAEVFDHLYQEALARREELPDLP
ncbi:hypothetical protein KZX47_05955 [Thermus sp. SYSU G05001]|jgi:hypothetical protein|uniref:Uncharacterized protein n=1 Tax=Thermus brevis TaxID=2862456 RepID=A0ABS6ZXB6_9DEIN|nr:hypothetical protein [Thermus brevis]MBW6394696.1 hypothetical protein [Thermus brevis]